VIDLEDAAVALGETDVFSDVSLSVAEGEFLGLVGPNGAGKTTLLRTVNGIVSPDAGRVTVAGTDVSTASAREVGRLVATVPQDTTVAFDFPVRDLVAMGRIPHRSRLSSATSDDEAAVDRALERTDTRQFADRPVGELSGGERQRVLLARALAQATPTLLLDEPTASLDIGHQARTLELARGLVAEGKTVVAAIHDLDLAARYCDALALLADGSLLARGPPGEVLTADLVGEAFDTTVAVGTDAVTGTPSVTVVPEE
jgi:iron complex transport system ATP-binding protein